MKRISVLKQTLCPTLALVLAAYSRLALAASGTWSADSDGNWSDASKWAGGTVADATGSTADFSSVDITGNRTVTLDTARMLSGLSFGDAGVTPNFNWTLTGPNALTLGPTPLINVANQTATISLPLAGTTGLTKVGNGTLTFLGTNSYTGLTLISNGVVNYNGASRSTSGGIFNVGGPAGRAVVNLNTTGAITNNGGYYGVGGTQGSTTDTGIGVINILAGTLCNGANNNYTEIGTGGLNGGGTYGCINLQAGGVFNTLGSSGIRVGAGGVGVFNMTGGSLNCSRWFAVGSQSGGANNANAGGIGLVNFLGGSVTIATGNRIILNDKNGGVGILNIGTAAGGTAMVAALNGNTTQAGINFMDQGGTTAKAILNLNSGTLRLAGPMYRNNAGGLVQFNWNGGTYQANAANMNFINTANGFTSVDVYNGGMVFDNQANNVTCPVQLLAAGGNGVYPEGGTLNLSSGGGSGYLGQPFVTVTNTGFGSNAMAIANLSGGAVASVTLTCPGQNYAAGDVLGFVFSGGGATTPTSAFLYTLTAGDLVANTNGGLTKLGAGTLTLTTNNTYSGSTLVSAGTLDVQYDGGLGAGHVTIANGATLTLQNGVNHNYIGASANLVLGSTAIANLSFSGNNSIHALSLDGGLTYMVPGTWGAYGSGATYEDGHFTGPGILTVATQPVGPSVSVDLVSSLNPSIYSQAVGFTVTVTGNSSVPTGTVTFKDGTTVLGTKTLDGAGTATFTTNSLAVGSHSITVVYNGNGTYTAKTSLPLTQVVLVGTEIWRGTVNGNWDINGTANWLTLAQGVSGKYLDGDNVEFDDSATGTTAVQLSVQVSPASMVVSNDAKAYSFNGAAGIAGTTGVGKAGTNVLTVNTSNTYSGVTTVTNGVVVFNTNSSSTGNGGLIVGGQSGAVVKVATTNSLSFSGAASIGGLTGNNGDANSGALRQQSGTLNLSGGNSYLELGAGGYYCYGTLELSGGTLNTVNASGIRVGAEGTGVFLQSGGTFNCSRYFAVGTQSGVNNIGGTGVATFTGGAANFVSGYRIIVGDKPGASGVLNIGTEAGGNAVLAALYNNNGFGGLQLLGDASANSAIINLNSGTLQLGGAIYRNAGAFGSPALNLNGGTLQAGANNINLITNEPSVFIGDFAGNLFSRGVVVDSQTNNCFITADLLATAGNGVYPAAGALSVNSGNGYVGAPVVSISGGSGSGAMAVATVTDGKIASVTMTCPGQNFVAGDTLYFDFTSGGATEPAGQFSYTLQAGDLKANANGGLTKMGSGQLTLTSLNNNYTGATVVSNGTLVVAGSLTGGGAVSVRGGTFGGTGTVSGAVTVFTNGALMTGGDSIGTFTINNSLTFQPGAACSVKVDKGLAAADLVQGLSHVTYAGTLVVTNLSGTLVVGDSFKLFAAASYSGSFSAVSPTIPAPGLAWDTTNLMTTGTLKIIAGTYINPNPTNLVFSVTGNSLKLSWPTDYIGWRLQVQTNALSVGLGTNWVDVAGSTLTNQMSFPVNPANGSVFFRMVH